MDKQRLKGIIMGLSLGDGHLMKAKRGKNASLRITHSQKQEEYIIYKKELLAELTLTKLRYTDPRPPRHPNVEITLDTRVHPLYTRAHEILYIEGKKTITKTALSWLTVEGLALWYMDDGSLSKSYKTLKNGERVVSSRHLWLHACGHPKEELELLSKYILDTYGVEFKVYRSNHYKGKDYYSLHTHSTMANKFLALVKPYILSSMEYKTDMMYKKPVLK